mmetsp:Transcript_6467/g.18952  ORF Transcript_6467/g.18952 Transcript_6467/m.18952 type:complete len:301 (-) Transcript_6467:1215-2117(-)
MCCPSRALQGPLQRSPLHRMPDGHLQGSLKLFDVDGGVVGIHSLSSHICDDERKHAPGNLFGLSNGTIGDVVCVLEELVKVNLSTLVFVELLHDVQHITFTQHSRWHHLVELARQFVLVYTPTVVVVDHVEDVLPQTTLAQLVGGQVFLWWEVFVPRCGGLAVSMMALLLDAADHHVDDFESEKTLPSLDAADGVFQDTLVLHGKNGGHQHKVLDRSGNHERQQARGKESRDEEHAFRQVMSVAVEDCGKNQKDQQCQVDGVHEQGLAEEAHHEARLVAAAPPEAMLVVFMSEVGLTVVA